MSATTDRLALVLLDGTGQHDISIETGASPADLLASVSYGQADLVVTTSTGVALDTQRALGEQVASGSVLGLMAPGSITTGYVDRRASWEPIPARFRFRAQGRRHIVALLAAVGAGVVVATQVISAGAGPGFAQWLVVAVLAIAALAVAARPAPSTSSILVTPLLALTAGVIAAPTQLAVDEVAAGMMALALGTVGAAVLAVVRYAMCRWHGSPITSAAGLVAVFMAIAASVAVSASVLELDPAAVPILLLGTVPLVLRALPKIALNIADEEVLDLPVVMKTVRSVRGTMPASPRRIRTGWVHEEVTSADASRFTGVLLMCVVVPVFMPAVLARAVPEGIVGWAAVAVSAFVSLTLALAPRSWSGTAVKLLPRAVLLIILVQAALIWRQEDHAVLMAGILLALAAAIVLTISPLAAGFRSLRWSRLGDIVEWIAVAFVLPAALVAAGALDALPMLTAG